MKNSQYLHTLLCIQLSITTCGSTIDVDLSQLSYLSKRLSVKQCRELFASLHFVSYDLPAALSAAVKTVPEEVSCIKLLVKWNSGTEKWEGRGKTHIDIEQRLRQIGRPDLADWLGQEAFHRLATNVDNALNNYFVDDSNIKRLIVKKMYEDKETVTDEWTVLDSILWVILMGILATLAFTFFRIIILMYKNTDVRKTMDEEEIVDLLSHGTRRSVESDQETIYQCIVKREHCKFKKHG